MDRKRLLEALIFATVAGCSDPSTIDPTTRRELEATQAQCKRASADVETLRKQGLAAPDLSALQLRLDAMAAEIAVLKNATGKAVKIPHLIAVETGADLGPFAGWDRYYSADVDDYVATAPTDESYPSSDCTGDGYVHFSPGATGPIAYQVGPDGTILRLGPRLPTSSMHSLHWKDANGSHCDPVDQSDQWRPTTDTKIAAPTFNALNLRVELH